MGWLIPGAPLRSTLSLELRGWERFQNRRQIASYTGLCPGIHNSNGRGREGSINRCGNSLVRYILIEMAWRILRWQPNYPPLAQEASDSRVGIRP
jgi:transposase